MQIGIILIALAFPLLELALLIKLGQSIGFWWTVLLLVAIAVAGGAIVRQQGLSAARRAMESARDGRPPIGPVVDSLLLMLAGVLLLMPGLITDVAGLLLLVPPLRRAFARWCRTRLFAAADVHVETRSGRSPGDRHQERPGDPRRAPDGGIVIDGEWERVEEPKPDTLSNEDGKGKPPHSR